MRELHKIRMVWAVHRACLHQLPYFQHTPLSEAMQRGWWITQTHSLKRHSLKSKVSAMTKKKSGGSRDQNGKVMEMAAGNRNDKTGQPDRMRQKQWRSGDGDGFGLWPPIGNDDDLLCSCAIIIDHQLPCVTQKGSWIMTLFLSKENRP